MCFGLEILGAVVGAIGSLASASAAANQAKTNAAIAEENAKTARMQGQVEADRREDENQALTARQRVAAIKSGVDPGSGSAALVIDQEGGGKGWMDEQMIAWNANSKANAYQNQAKAFKQEAKGIMIGGAFKAGSSIIGGFGKGGYTPTIT